MRTGGVTTADVSLRRPPCAPLDDPWASSLTANPYVSLPDVFPNMPIAVINRIMQSLQRQGIRPHQRRAFQTLRNLNRRLLWDALTAGSTPGVSSEEWHQTSEWLGAGARDVASQYWTSRAARGMQDPGALHVTAVMTLNEAVASPGGANQSLLRLVIACWAPLLDSRAWLGAFVEERLRTWGYHRRDAANVERFGEDLASQIEALLLASSGNSQQQRSHVLSILRQERAALVVARSACGWQLLLEQTAGLGPAGLDRQPERRSAVRSWLLRGQRSWRGGLPLSELRSGRVPGLQAGLSPAGAVAMLCCYSELGAAGAEVWNRNGEAALHLMPPHSLLGDGAQALDDSWFGSGEDAWKRRYRTATELLAEALLLALGSQLGDPDAPPQQVADLAERLLRVKDALRAPAVVAERLEELFVGRGMACIENDDVSIAELSRVSAAVETARERLSRSERLQLCQARLLLCRAAKRWKACRVAPCSETIRSQVMQDVWQAAQLAPRSSEVALTLGALTLALTDHLESEAELRSLLRHAVETIDRCGDGGGSAQQLRDVRQRLMELLDPRAAREEALRQLRAARASAAQRAPGGKTAD